MTIDKLHDRDFAITIDGEEYHLSLENNPTARAFAKMLPINLTLEELNGNEKYVYLDTSLPTDASMPKEIHAGDVMLYENNCLVIFYKTFRTPYSYTRIGRIDGLPKLWHEMVEVTIAAAQH